LIYGAARKVRQPQAIEAAIAAATAAATQAPGENRQAELETQLGPSNQTLAFYTALYRDLPIPLNIYQLLDPGDARSLTLRFSNPAALEATGLDGDRMIGQGIVTCFPGVSEAELERHAQVARREIENQQYQLPYQDRNGLAGIFKLRLFALPDRCLGIVFDEISQEVQLKARLRRSEQHFRTTFEQAPIGVAHLSQDGQWIEVNDRLCEILGYEREALQHKTSAAITHPDDRQQDAHYLAQLVSGAVESCRFDKRYLCCNGDSLWTSIAVTALRDPEGQIHSFIAMIQDISDRKAHELERAERARELRQLNKTLARTTLDLKRRNEELDQFTYVVSHDLKAPLRALSSLAGWVAEDNADKLDEESTRHLALMQQRVMRMGNLLNGLLDYSRIGRVNAETETIVLGQLLATIVDSLGLPDGFQVEIIEPMPALEARAISLSQVFSNLISNAARYCDRPDGRLRISARETAETYEFTLADNGPGIDARYHDRVFDIFQTLQPRDSSESTGIGLSIVKKIITVEQGKIWLDPNPEIGATFHISWPKANAPED
jgi:PAS domain S-box-containing protein